MAKSSFICNPPVVKGLGRNQAIESGAVAVGLQNRCRAIRAQSPVPAPQTASAGQVRSYFIVLPRQSCRFYIPAETATDVFDAVCGHRFAVSRAVQNQAALGGATRYGDWPERG